MAPELQAITFGNTSMVIQRACHQFEVTVFSIAIWVAMYGIEHPRRQCISQLQASQLIVIDRPNVIGIDHTPINPHLLIRLSVAQLPELGAQLVIGHGAAI